MKQYIISFICFSCLLLSGCNYLDTEPGDAISGDYFWETANAAALEQYCNLYYPKLIKGHGDPLSWNVGAMIMADYQSDNILVSGGSSITYGQNTKLTSNSDWNWSTVRGCNSFCRTISDLRLRKWIRRSMPVKSYFSKHSIIIIKCVFWRCALV